MIHIPSSTPFSTSTPVLPHWDQATWRINAGNYTQKANTKPNKFCFLFLFFFLSFLTGKKTKQLILLYTGLLKTAQVCHPMSGPLGWQIVSSWNLESVFLGAWILEACSLFLWPKGGMYKLTSWCSQLGVVDSCHRLFQKAQEIPTWCHFSFFIFTYALKRDQQKWYRESAQIHTSRLPWHHKDYHLWCSPTRKLQNPRTQFLLYIHRSRWSWV